VICYFRKGRDGEDVQFAQTTVISDAENTLWEHPVVFENYQPRTLQVIDPQQNNYREKYLY